MIKIIWVILIILVYNLSANPLEPLYISETDISNDNWWIELYDKLEIGSDEFELFRFTTTNSEVECPAVAFPDTILITQQDVNGNLIFDHSGDFLRFSGLLDENWLFLDEISWGNYPDANVNSPLPGQSLGRVILTTEIRDDVAYLVKNSQPTPGEDPFNVNSKGLFTGLVQNQQDEPLAGIRIEYFPPYFLEYCTYSQDDGSFAVELYGMNYYIGLYMDETLHISDYLSVEPEETIFRGYIIDLPSEIDQQVITNHLPVLINYPNPFNPITMIRLQGLENSSGSYLMKIYSITGREINSLNLNFPDYTACWDGRDASGNKMPSGIYLGKVILSDNSSAECKFLLLK
ncbi:MAG: hypothetical protein JW996_00080 [Candidatus Cloacimonetes bacterium]|nr:hypothetical protein [Candidatus Cloacimonadota bacterium]